MVSELILPYGPAPTIAFVLHELAMYILFALCLVHAVRRGAVNTSYLLGGVMFGLLLEYVNVNAGINYSYGQFWLMLGPMPEPDTIPMNIPINIGIGWGIIIYTAKLFSDNLGLPIWSRPAVDALLALNIDLSMDVVAYRLNMWHWGWEFLPTKPDPLTTEWFGVPYANFFGWLFVVFFYSAFARLLLGWQSKKRGLLWLRMIISVVASIIFAQAILFMSITTLPNWLSSFRGKLFPSNTSSFAILSLIAIIIFAFLIVLGYRQRQSNIISKNNHLISWLVPTYFHIYFITWFFISGFYREGFWLSTLSVINVAIGLLLHYWEGYVSKTPKVLTTSDAVTQIKTIRQ